MWFQHFQKFKFPQVRRRAGVRGRRGLREGQVVRLPLGLLLQILRRRNEEEKGKQIRFQFPNTFIIGVKRYLLKKFLFQNSS